MGLPLGYVYLVIPLSGALIVLYALLDAAGSARVLRGAAPAPERTA